MLPLGQPLGKAHALGVAIPGLGPYTGMKSDPGTKPGTGTGTATEAGAGAGAGWYSSEFQATHGYIARPCFKQTTNINGVRSFFIHSLLTEFTAKHRKYNTNNLPYSETDTRQLSKIILL